MYGKAPGLDSPPPGCPPKYPEAGLSNITTRPTVPQASCGRSAWRRWDPLLEVPNLCRKNPRPGWYFSFLECRRWLPQFVPGAKASRENHARARPRSCTGPRSFRLSFPTIPSGPKRRVWPQTAWELPLAPKEEIPPRTDTRNEKGLAATRRAWVLMIY